MTRCPAAIVPPSVADARGRAFGAILSRAVDEPDFLRLLVEQVDDVDAGLLPFLMREFGMQDFLEPGMSEAALRRLLKGAYALKARAGYVDGLKTAFAMIGLRVTAWEQWFQATPRAAPGTHVVTLAIEEPVFEAEGRAITARLLRLLTRMIAVMGRLSQFVAPRFEVESAAPVSVGAAVVTRLRVSPSSEPITHLTGAPPLFVGAAVVTRAHVRPQT